MPTTDQSLQRQTTVVNVFLLWHEHKFSSGEDEAKLIGVYATRDDAEAARRHIEHQPGFVGAPDGFTIDRYEVGRDHWAEGYFTSTSWSWTVWRKDASGGSTQMATGLAEADARDVLKRLSQKDSKHRYYVRHHDSH